MKLFRSRTPTIPGHEDRLAEIDQQIADGERDHVQAEADATNVALDGGNLAVATDTVVRIGAELTALRAARAQIVAELADLRAKAQKETELKNRQTAKSELLRLADALADVDGIKPLLSTLSNRMVTADRWLGTRSAENVSPALYALDGATHIFTLMADQVRSSAESIDADDDAYGAKADLAQRVLAHPFVEQR